MRKSYIHDTYLSNSNEISYSESFPIVQMWELIDLIDLAIGTTSYCLSINLTRNETY